MCQAPGTGTWHLNFQVLGAFCQVTWRRTESCWLYQFYGMKDQFPLRCTLFVLIWCSYSLDGLNTFDFINHMTRQINISCGALYFYFIHGCSWLYSCPCGALYLYLFILYLLLPLVIYFESGWLYQWYGMKDQLSLRCTLFVLIHTLFDVAFV